MTNPDTPRQNSFMEHVKNGSDPIDRGIPVIGAVAASSENPAWIQSEYIPEQRLAIATEIDRIGTTLTHLEEQERSLSFVNSEIGRLDADTKKGVYVDEPDLRLAATSMLAGSWSDAESVNKYYMFNVRPVLEQNEDMGAGVWLIDKLVGEVGGVLSVRKEMRTDIGSDKKLATMIEKIDAMPVPESAKIQLKVTASGLLFAAAAPERKPARLENIKQIILG